MMPHTNSTSASPRTIRRLPSAKSTTRRIIYWSVLSSQFSVPSSRFSVLGSQYSVLSTHYSECSLLHRVLQIECVGYHLIARLNAGDDFLLFFGKHAACDHFHAFEMSVT